MTPRSASKKGTSYLKIFWIIFLCPFLLFLIVILMAAKGWIGEDLPSFAELENPKSALASEIISSDQVILGKYFIQNRTNIHYYELAPALVQALRATEDIRFEEHSGIDLRGLVRAVIGAGTAGGGSTITQQLAKNLFHERPKNKLERVVQKFQEWVIAVELERRYTKEEIIALYLNTVEFSSNAFGIKSAARTYFNKNPDSLSIQEAAVLIGMLQAPTKFNPSRNPENAILRRNIVLSQMEKYEYITPTALDSLKKLPIKLDYLLDDQNFGIATYFREVLRLELNQWCKEHKNNATGKPYNLYTDGLKIHVTIDSRMQRYAEEAMRQHLSELQKIFDEHWAGRDPLDKHESLVTEGMKRSDRYISMKSSGATQREIETAFNQKIPMQVFSWSGPIDTLMSPMDSIRYHKKILQSGFMTIEPSTGHVKSWVGGNDFRFFKYDHVKTGKRQVGSTIKPFLYTLAMQEGYSPCSQVPNVKVTFEMSPGHYWSPDNSGGGYGNMISLKAALAGSVNTISAYLMKQFGPKAMIEMCRKMGIESEMDVLPSICLGTSDISVYEMVGGYATFANKGVYIQPQYITRIEDKNGNVLQEFIPKKVEAISEQTAYLMTSLMKGVVEFGTSTSIRSKYKLTAPIAGKTGTTQNQSDGWFMGVTPELTGGVWVGCEDRAIHFRTTNLGQGARMALPVWALFMQKVYADSSINLSTADFEYPSGGLAVELDCAKYRKDNEDEINTEDKDF
ncbi:MAG: penicillin-binding protein 1A [Bacteroidota bacterium]